TDSEEFTTDSLAVTTDFQHFTTDFRHFTTESDSFTTDSSISTTKSAQFCALFVMFLDLAYNRLYLYKSRSSPTPSTPTTDAQFAADSHAETPCNPYSTSR